MGTNSSWYVSVGLVLVWATLFAHGDKTERLLYHTLKERLNKLERPTENNSEPVVVSLGISLQQIIGLDEKNQILTINAWLKFSWKDGKMAWAQEDFDGIGSVRFPVSSIWKPDVLMYNSVDASFDSTYKTNVVVYSDGSMNWVPPGIFKVACSVDITYFPWDEQVCTMKFGSWTYDGTKLDLQPDPAPFDMSEYMINGEWNLTATIAQRNITYYECCPEPYPDVKFIFKMRRRILYYFVNLILPNTVITCMTLLGFMLPVEAFEKITLQITVLLSICVFLNIVANLTPPTSEAIPLLGVFFLLCLVLNATSCVLTVLVINLHIRNPDTHTMGRWTKNIFLFWMPWILGMKRPEHKFKWNVLPPLCASNLDNPSESLLRNVRETSDEETLRTRAQSLDLEQKINFCVLTLSESPSSLSQGQQAEILALQRICSQLKSITRTMIENDEYEEVVSDWKFIATVIDRLCLVTLSGAFVASFAYIVHTAPFLYA